jgi:hypothetical protein
VTEQSTKNQIKDTLKEEIILEKWFNLYNQFNELLGLYLGDRENSLSTQMEKLSEVPTFDSAIQTQVLYARINELKRFLSILRHNALKFKKLQGAKNDKAE